MFPWGSVLKQSGIVRAFVAATFLLLTQFAAGQTQLAVHSTANSGADVWSVYAGGSMAANASGHNFGWQASVTENPYKSLPWLGGTIEMSQYFNHGTVMVGSTKVTRNSSTSLIMGGPSVSFMHGALQPFVHALVGGAISSGTGDGFAGPFHSASNSGSDHTLGMALGAGVDFAFSSRAGIRTQWDWMRVGTSNAASLFRGSAGLYVRF